MEVRRGKHSPDSERSDINGEMAISSGAVLMKRETFQQRVADISVLTLILHTQYQSVKYIMHAKVRSGQKN